MSSVDVKYSASRDVGDGVGVGKKRIFDVEEKEEKSFAQKKKHDSALQMPSRRILVIEERRLIIPVTQ